MKVKKLLAKAESMLSSKKRKRKEKKKYLKHVIKKLRVYEEELNDRLQNETDQESIQKLNRKISLVHAQRKKGLVLMQQLSDSNN